MCMEDVRLSRQADSTQLLQSVTTSEVVLVDADVNRFALIISAPSAGVLTLSFNPIFLDNEGITLKTGDPALKLSLLEVGSMVTRKIFARMSAGTVTIAVWLSTLPKQ